MTSSEIMDKIHSKAAEIVGSTNDLLKCIAVNDENVELVAQCFANYHNSSIEDAREYTTELLNFLKDSIKKRKDLYELWANTFRAELAAK